MPCVAHGFRSIEMATLELALATSSRNRPLWLKPTMITGGGAWRPASRLASVARLVIGKAHVYPMTEYPVAPSTGSSEGSRSRVDESPPPSCEQRPLWEGTVA